MNSHQQAHVNTHLAREGSQWKFSRYYLWVFLLAYFYFQNVLQGVYFSHNNYFCSSFSRLKKKFMFSPPSVMTTSRHPLWLAILYSHDTKNQVKNSVEKERNWFYSPKPTSTVWTGVTGITCVLSLFFRHTNLANVGRVCLKLELRWKIQWWYLRNLEYRQAFHQLSLRCTCCPNSATGSLKGLHLLDSLRAKKQPNLRMSWSPKNKPRIQCVCLLLNSTAQKTGKAVFLGALKTIDPGQKPQLLWLRGCRGRKESRREHVSELRASVQSVPRERALQGLAGRGGNQGSATFPCSHSAMKMEDNPGICPSVLGWR